jgi:hypothetical protein
MAKCEDCKYFILEKEFDCIGECHRYPPFFRILDTETNKQEEESDFCLISRDCWCGEFQPKEEDNG